MSIEKLEMLRLNSDKNDLLQIIDKYLIQAPKKEITAIPVKLGDRMILVRIEDILYLSAEEKYVTIHLIDGKTHLCDNSLKNLEEKLVCKFIRIHRSLLINLIRIKEIHKHFG